MLMPKRVKRRRVFRGRMKGKAMRGNFLAYGDFGLVATEPSWITSQQIEAARIALTRYTPDAAVSSWESAVDMVHARIPARTTPATMDNSSPWRPSRSARRMMTVSDSELEEKAGMLPATEAL